MAYHEIDGALFKDAPVNDGKRHPKVLGVKMQVAVWPAEKSTKGFQYWPVSGDYARNETKRLVPVNVSAIQADPTQGAQTPTGEGAPAQEGGEGGDLPF